MIIKTLTLGPIQNNCHIIGCPETREGAVIDPGWDAQTILSEVESLDLTIKYVLNTHGHWDVTSANGAVLKATGAKLAIHPLEKPLLEARGGADLWGIEIEPSPEPDIELQNDQVLEIGRLAFRVLHTPGHTPGHVSFYEATVGAVFTGDTLYRGKIGRFDLPGGNHDALVQSVDDVLLSLPLETVIYPSHGLATTVGEERHDVWLSLIVPSAHDRLRNAAASLPNRIRARDRLAAAALFLSGIRVRDRLGTATATLSGIRARDRVGNTAALLQSRIRARDRFGAAAVFLGGIRVRDRLGTATATLSGIRARDRLGAAAGALGGIGVGDRLRNTAAFLQNRIQASDRLATAGLSLSHIRAGERLGAAAALLLSQIRARREWAIGAGGLAVLLVFLLLFRGGLSSGAAAVPTATASPTLPVLPTDTSTSTATATATSTATATATATATRTSTPTATRTATSTPTATATNTPTNTPTRTPTPTRTRTPTATRTPTDTPTPTPTATPTFAPPVIVPTATPVPTAVPTQPPSPPKPKPTQPPPQPTQPPPQPTQPPPEPTRPPRPTPGPTAVP